MACSTRILVARTMTGGTLTIGGVLMHRSAFAVTQTKALRQSSDRRGANQLMPYVPGLIPKRKRNTETAVELPLAIEGRFTTAGAVSADPRNGLLANIEWLEANLVADPGGDGTRFASLTTPGGATKTGGVQVLGLIEEKRSSDGLWLGRLKLLVPAGRLG